MNILRKVFEPLLAALAGLLLTGAAAGQIARTTFKFDFGTGRPAPEYMKVTPTTMYTDELGYGLEPGSTVEALDRGGKDPLKGDFLTSDQPFYFR